MRFLWNFIKYLVCISLVLIIGIGLYIGNTAYLELTTKPWDQRLNITNHTEELQRIHRLEQRNNWQQVQVHSLDGTLLTGTYIENPSGSHTTVIILHGLYQNRTMSVPYAQIYLQEGYNVLMPDIRGHGESQGNINDWGIHNTEDMNTWVTWLQQKDPRVSIGFHGISLGGAMSLLYAGTAQGQALKFIVADSAYGNILELGQEKLMGYTGDQRLLHGMQFLEPFFEIALFYHTQKTLRDLDPAASVKQMTAPVLFLHGEQDLLIPAHIAEDLENESNSNFKKLTYFEKAGHANALSTDPEAYAQTIKSFLSAL